MEAFRGVHRSKRARAKHVLLGMRLGASGGRYNCRAPQEGAERPARFCLRQRATTRKCQGRVATTSHGGPTTELLPGLEGLVAPRKIVLSALGPVRPVRKRLRTRKSIFCARPLGSKREADLPNMAWSRDKCQDACPQPLLTTHSVDRSSPARTLEPIPTNSAAALEAECTISWQKPPKEWPRDMLPLPPPGRRNGVAWPGFRRDSVSCALCDAVKLILESWGARASALTDPFHAPRREPYQLPPHSCCYTRHGCVSHGRHSRYSHAHRSRRCSR